MSATSSGAVVTLLGNVSLPFPMAGYQPLAGSLVVVANAVNNTVVLLDADSGSHLATTLLPSTPVSMAVDVLAATFWVVPTAGAFLMHGGIRAGGHATKVPLPCSPTSVALGTSLVFAACSGFVVALSATSGRVLSTMASPAISAPLVASVSDSQLVVAGLGLGGCMWSMDVSVSTSGSVSMVVSGTVQECENVEDLVMSPDGNHVAFINGGGNCAATGLSACDFNANNVSGVLGAWVTGDMPTAGSFSPDSSLVAIITSTGEPTMQLFGTQRHNRVAYLGYQSFCSMYSDYRQVLFSTDGHRGNSSVVCGYEKYATHLFFFSVM